jgi:proteasome accessory factor B
MPKSPRTPKVQRWIDLVAALLRYHFPVDFATLAAEVPAYHRARSGATLKRMFERDKDELRALGIPIESVVNADGVIDRYRLRPQDFYLPYLAMVEESGRRQEPMRARGHGYQALPSLAFSADELELVWQAAERVVQLGDPQLARDAASARRKLAHDLAPTGPNAPSAEQVVTSGSATDAHRQLELLDDAIRCRKHVEFAYHAFASDATTTREVAPYGLVFLSGVWYLIGREPGSEPVKRYRLQRMAALRVNPAQPQQPDFHMPPSFRLADFAAVRQPWEIGTGEPVTALVRFTPTHQVTHDAMALGDPADGAPHHRRYQLRRVETFARWLLAHGGDAIPESPPSLVRAFHDLLAATRAVYEPQDPKTAHRETPS